MWLAQGMLSAAEAGELKEEDAEKNVRVTMRGGRSTQRRVSGVTDCGFVATESQSSSVNNRLKPALPSR